MTPGAPNDHEELFVADFYPELGEYLAEQHATGYDAVVARTHFVLWLARHVDPADAIRQRRKPSERGGTDRVLKVHGPGASGCQVARRSLGAPS
jgi:hypothetical protein